MSSLSALMDKHSYLLHTLITAVRSRVVTTLDAENMQPLPADVRVGQVRRLI